MPQMAGAHAPLAQCSAPGPHGRPHPALHAPDQPQSRTLPPHPARAMGLRGLRASAPTRPHRLSPLLQLRSILRSTERAAPAAHSEDSVAGRHT